MREWFRANILGGMRNDYVGPARDFGTALPPASMAGNIIDPVAPGSREIEERLIASVERIEEVKDGLETALHGREPPHLDVGGAAFGFGTGVLSRVLAHILARSIGKEKA